ncbi:MAG: DegQ family serine endoprotease [Methylobacteriaceae bacterium]|jgi:serine protease Do|nr:DegQ family serine endoprotease [Methylobacteriaceae bacterium]
MVAASLFENFNPARPVLKRCRLALVAGMLAVAAIFPAQAGPAPESFADLTANVMDAVVNISATTKEDVTQRNLRPEMQDNQDMEEFFRRFFGDVPQRPGDRSRPVRPRRSSSLGSGFIIDASGVVVTNNHVVGEANDITVILQDGTELKADIVGKDPKVDIAVLKVKTDKPLKAVSFGDSEKLRPGDWVLAIGNPFGLGGTVTSGIVSARGRNIQSGPYDNYIQTDAAINKGNSGGPLFNMAGEVVGINTAIYSPTGGSIGIGFAVPASSAVPVIKQLREFGEIRRGWLGVAIQNVDEDSVEALGLGEAHGALVAKVDADGPAAKAGLETGDVIVRFDGKDVKSSRDLPRIVAETAVGKTVDVVVIRKGKEQTFPVTLGLLKDDDSKGSIVAPGAPLPGRVEPVLGLSLSDITDELRQRYRIDESIKGVIVTRVDPQSVAADKHIEPGDVILEVGQEKVASPADVAEAVKKSTRKSVLFLISSGRSGDTRFVALPIKD